MKIEQLHQVLEVYQAGSINKAAQNLFISQPCISSSIKSLETSLGQKIFRRSHVGIQLTEFGELFIRNARKILVYADEIELAARNISSGSIPLSFSISVYYLRFAHIVFHELLQKYQETATNFRYHQASISDVITDIYNRNTELGLISIPNIDKEKWMAKLELDDLYFDRIYASPPSAMLSSCIPYPVNKNGCVSLQELQNLSLAIISERLPLFDSLNKKMRYLLGAKSVIEVNDRSTNHEFIQNNKAYACVVNCKNAYRSVDFFDYATMYTIEDLPFVFEVGWLYRKDTPPSLLAKEYMTKVEALLNDKP